MDEPLERPPLSATDGVAWTGVFGGPLAWFASQQVSYALVPWACHGGSLIAIHLVNLAALLVVILAGAMAWRDWRRPGRHVSDETAPPEGRQRFLGPGRPDALFPVRPGDRRADDPRLHF